MRSWWRRLDAPRRSVVSPTSRALEPGEGSASRSPASAALDVVAEAIGLSEAAAAADLVVTGEGAYDFSSRAGSTVHHVANLAQAALRPCVVLAGKVLVGAREMRAMGVESAYSVVDVVGERRAVEEPAESLALLAKRVARTWSRLPE
jgi:glycerate kinase